MRAFFSRARWRIFPIAAVLLLLTIPVLPVAAQAIEGTTTLVQIDSPAAGTTVSNGQSVRIQGWAADPAGPGTGVAEVHVYLDGQAGQGGTGLGAATYGLSRPDVAQAYGRTDWANTGYELAWTPTGLSSGSHTIYVYARSLANSWQYKTVSVTVSGPSATATPPPGGMMPPGAPGAYPPGPPSGNPYGFTPPQNQIGPQSNYGTGYPYGDINGPAGIPCGAPGYDVPDIYTVGVCPPPPPPLPPAPYPPGAYPPGAIPPVGPSGYVVPVQASPAGTVGLSWAPVPNASEYDVYQSNNPTGQGGTLVKTLPQSTGSLNISTTITGLTPGQTYFFSVRAIVNGTAQPVLLSGTVTGNTIGGPPGPIAVQVGSVTSNSVTLTWAPVPGAVRYRITQAVGTSTAFTGATVVNSSSTGATIIGLQPSTTYTFRISAIDSFGVEGPGVIVQATTTA